MVAKVDRSLQEIKGVTRIGGFNISTPHSRSSYVRLEIPVGTVKTNFEIMMAGTSMYVEQAPVAFNVRIHTKLHGNIPLERGNILNDDIGWERFFLSHANTHADPIILFIGLNISFSQLSENPIQEAKLFSERSLAMAVAGTEYNVVIADNTKILMLVNRNVASLISVSFIALGSATGFYVKPLSNLQIPMLDFDTKTLYAQSNTATDTLYIKEFTA